MSADQNILPRKKIDYQISPKLNDESWFGPMKYFLSYHEGGF